MNNKLEEKTSNGLENFSPQSSANGANGIPSAGKDNETGFVFENRNIDDLVKKINKLFSDSEQYQRFSDNARKRVIEKFSDQVISKKLIQIYKTLLPND